MPKKKKKNELRYITEKSYRWGLCMKLAKVAYRSSIGEHQIKENIEMILQEYTTLGDGVRVKF